MSKLADKHFLRSSSPPEVQVLEGAKAVTVCWPDHPRVLLDGVWRCLNDRYKVDVDCKAGGRLVQAHQLILSIFCPGFEERLCSSDDPEALLQLDCEMDGDDLDLLLEFIYRGEVTIPRDRLGGLQEAARDLRLQAMNDALTRLQREGEDCGQEVAAGAQGSARQATSKKAVARGARKRKGKPVKISPIPPKKCSGCDGVDDEWKPEDSSNVEGGKQGIRPPETGRRLRTRNVASNSKPPKEVARTRTSASTKGNSQDTAVSRAQEDGGTGKPSRSGARQKRWRLKQPHLQCPHCSYGTRDKVTYSSHVAKHDPNAKRFTCETCSKTFRNQGSFRRHVRSHRNPEKLYKCTECEFRTPQKSTWIQHLAAIHQMDQEGRWLAPDVRCVQCDFACFTEYQLKSHVARKHATDKPHKCPECSYASIAKCDIEKHVRIMHRNERPYMCETCGFRSKTRSAFNMHVRSHTGLKPYKCEICGQAYTRSDKLKAHLQKHASGDGKFVCHTCGQVCDTRDEFMSHIKRDHSIAPETEQDDGRELPDTVPHKGIDLKENAPDGMHYGLPNLGMSPNNIFEPTVLYY